MKDWIYTITREGVEYLGGIAVERRCALDMLADYIASSVHDADEALCVRQAERDHWRAMPTISKWTSPQCDLLQVTSGGQR